MTGSSQRAMGVTLFKTVAGKPPGRPRKPYDERKTARIEIRCTQAQREKVTLLGGAPWICERIDKARVPQ